MEEILQHWPQTRVKRALELGCGNGLAAVYLGTAMDRVIASDLPSVDHHAHSIGLRRARDLIRLMRVENADVLGCSAQAIPLADNSVDFVYGIYSFEHFPDRPSALREVRRVLQSEGEVLFTVPGSVWALFMPFGFYRELLRRIAKRALRKFRKVGTPVTGERSAPQFEPVKVTNLASFHHHYPHFPLPEPHGTHSSWWSEVAYYRRSNWYRVMERAGFHNIRVIPVSFLPSFATSLLPRPWVDMAERWLKRHERFAPWAQLFCIRATAP